MARIPEGQLDRLKQGIAIQRLAEGKGGARRGLI